MSDNHNQEQVLGGSGAQENEGEGFSNGFVYVDSSVDPSRPLGAAGSSNVEEVSVFTVPADVADMSDSVIQEPSSLQVERVNQRDGVLVTRADSIPEDGIREDMFVDCPDELVGYDGRNSDNREPAVIPETQPRMEEKDDKQETHFLESDSRGQVDDLMEELEHLRAMLENTVSEKESLSREHEEEREAFVKERLQTEATFRELQSNLFMKDEEIGYLHAKISELSEFSKAQHGEDQYIEAIASRLLASLARCSSRRIVDLL